MKNTGKLFINLLIATMSLLAAATAVYAAVVLLLKQPRCHRVEDEYDDYDDWDII